MACVKTLSSERRAVSDDPWPRSERLDGRVLFAAADQCAVDQPQGVSSASRLLGQLLTSLVSTSVRYASGLTPCSLQLSISEASIPQFSAPSSLPANRAFFLLRARAVARIGEGWEQRHRADRLHHFLAAGKRCMANHERRPLALVRKPKPTSEIRTA
jgi:hypothetical protein